MSEKDFPTSRGGPVVFCLGSAALAEGFTVSGDLTLGSPNDGGDDDLGYLTIGGDYDLDPFIVGGSLLVCVYMDPPLTDTQEAMTFLYGVYGGYNLVNR